MISSEIILKLDRNTELTQAADVMMTQAKRMYILMVTVNRTVVFNVFVTAFSKRLRKHVLCVSFGESTGELKKAVETLRL